MKNSNLNGYMLKIKRFTQGAMYGHSGSSSFVPPIDLLSISFTQNLPAQTEVFNTYRAIARLENLGSETVVINNIVYDSPNDGYILDNTALNSSIAPGEQKFINVYYNPLEAGAAILQLELHYGNEKIAEASTTTTAVLNQIPSTRYYLVGDNKVAGRQDNSEWRVFDTLPLTVQASCTLNFKNKVLVGSLNDGIYYTQNRFIDVWKATTVISQPINGLFIYAPSGTYQKAIAVCDNGESYETLDGDTLTPIALPVHAESIRLFAHIDSTKLWLYDGGRLVRDDGAISDQVLANVTRYTHIDRHPTQNIWYITGYHNNSPRLITCSDAFSTFVDVDMSAFPADCRLNGFLHTGSTLIVVGGFNTFGLIATTTDEINWIIDINFPYEFTDVVSATWGYLVVGHGEYGYYSTDISSWVIYNNVPFSTISHLQNHRAPELVNNLVLSTDIGRCIAGRNDNYLPTETTLNANTKIYGVIYGNNKFLAADENNNVHTSYDGATWEQFSLQTSEMLEGGAYLNKQYFIFCTNGVMLRGEDGESFEVLTPLPGETRTLKNAAFDGQLIVAVGSGGLVISSNDNGDSWQELTSIGSYDCQDIIYRGGKWIVCTADGTFHSSTDLASWTTTTPAGTHNFHNLLYSASRIIALGHVIFYSVDNGDTWNPGYTAEQVTSGCYDASEDRFIMGLDDNSRHIFVTQDGITGEITKVTDIPQQITSVVTTSEKYENFGNPTLRVNIDASLPDTVTITGDAVISWESLTGYTDKLYTGSVNIAYSLNHLNDLNAILLTPSQSMFLVQDQLLGFSGNHSFYIAIVFRTNTVTTKGCLCRLGHAGSAYDSPHVFINDGENGNISFNVVGTSLKTQASLISLGGTYVVIFNYPGTTIGDVQCYINNVPHGLTLSGSNNPINLTDGGLRVGRYSNTSSDSLNAYMAQVLIGNRELTNTEINDLNATLTTKWVESFIALDAQGNLVADKTVIPSLASADNVIFDWRKNNKSMAVLNSPCIDNGAVAKDFTHYERDGTLLNGLSYDATEKSYYFDGANDYLSFAHSDDYNTPLGGGFTLFYQVKPFELDYYAFVSKGYGTLGQKTPWYLLGYGRGYLRNGGNVTADDFNATLNVWNSIAHRITNDAMEFYNNNDYKANSSVSGISSQLATYRFGTDRNLEIGGTHSSDYKRTYFKNLLIYPFALSPEQMTNCHQENFHILASQELTSGAWTCVATPVTNEEVGNPVISNTVFIEASVPLVINENQELEAIVSGIPSLANADDVIYDFRKDGQSHAIINAPFASSTYNINFSTYTENTLTEDIRGTGAIAWSSTAGKDGKGAIVLTSPSRFDGAIFYVPSTSQSLTALGVNDTYSITFRLKYTSLVHEQWHGMYAKGTYNGNSGMLFNASGNFYRYYNPAEYDSYYAPSINTWYRIVVTCSPSQAKIYVLPCDTGAPITPIGIKPGGNNMNNSENLYLLGTKDYYFIDGVVDDIKLYSHELSEEHIGILYNDQDNKIAAQEMNPGETWSCIATPINTGIAGTPVNLGSILI